MRSDGEEDTLELEPASPLSRAKPPEPLSSLVKVDLAAQTHKGKVRQTNEDNYLVARGGRSLEVLLSSVAGQMSPRSDETGYAMVVADGMGGAAAGEIASSSALVSLVAFVLNTPDWILQTNETMSEEIKARIHARFLEVNSAVSELAKETPELAGMGTTLTVAWSIGHDLFVGHVGDSRAYLFRGGVLHRLTRDQTLAQAMIDGGMIKPDDDIVRRFKHVLTQAIGLAGDSLQPEVRNWRVEDGDRLLLCTDGLTEMADDSLIAATLLRHEHSSEACQALVELALEKGGVDNITVVIARYRFPTPN